MAERKEIIKQLLKEYQPKDTQEIQEMLKDLMSDTIQEMLNSELDEDLGYEK